MKKKVLLIALVAIFVTIIASGTMAFFTAEGQFDNEITTHAVDIQIEEWQQTDDGLVPCQSRADIPMMPNTKVSRIVTMKNVEADAFVRAAFAIEVYDADGTKLDLELQKIDEMVSLTMNGEDWVRKDGDDTWWYYNGAVAAGDSTEEFLTEVIFDGENITDDYQGCTVKVLVDAQAVQTAHNGDSPTGAVGWPEE